MIKVIKNDDKYKRGWKLEIDNKIIEKIKLSLYGEKLRIFSWLDKTQDNFFEQTPNDYFLLKSNEIEEVEITISANNVFDTEMKQVFPDDFFPTELKEKLSEENDDSSTFLVISTGKDNKALARLSFIEFIFAAQFWKYPFSLHEYLSVVRKYLAHECINEENDIYIGQFNFLLPINLTLKEIFNTVTSDLKYAFTKALDELEENTENYVLTTRFIQFPAEIRVPCEQYLLYFAEFLRDLGVNAITEIKHEAGEVLFSIVPSDPNYALSSIKNALDVYLQLPKGELIIVSDSEFEIAMLKVKANVEHLNSQLSLAKAEIRVKEKEIQALEATLEAKDISIQNLKERFEQQKNLLKGEIAEGIIKVEPNIKEEDKEEFFDGVFALTQFEEKGFRVNLAQLFRKLRDLFKQEN